MVFDEMKDEGEEIQGVGEKLPGGAALIFWYFSTLYCSKSSLYYIFVFLYSCVMPLSFQCNTLSLFEFAMWCCEIDLSRRGRKAPVHFVGSFNM
jgi:hypothetical protein